MSRKKRNVDPLHGLFPFLLVVQSVTLETAIIKVTWLRPLSLLQSFNEKENLIKESYCFVCRYSVAGPRK